MLGPDFWFGAWLGFICGALVVFAVEMVFVVRESRELERERQRICSRRRG